MPQDGIEMLWSSPTQGAVPALTWVGPGDESGSPLCFQARRSPFALQGNDLRIITWALYDELSASVALRIASWTCSRGAIRLFRRVSFALVGNVTPTP